MKKNKIKLSVELVPKTCHFSNVRTTLSKKDWDKIRFICYDNADHKCEICGQTGLEQGYPHKVECHEIWQYNDKKYVQKLVGLIALCPLCHQVKHIGRANAMGLQAQAFNQLEIVNQWTHKEVVEHLAESFNTYRERSQHEWALDITLLRKPPYNIDINPDIKRKFKNKFKRRFKLKKKKS